MKRKKWKTAIVIAMLAGMLAGCGDRKDTSVETKNLDGEGEKTADVSAAGDLEGNKEKAPESAGQPATGENLMEGIPKEEILTEAYPQKMLLSRVLFYYPNDEDSKDEDVFLEYEYDAAGNKILEKNYIYHERIEYEYDASGLLLSRDTYFKDGLRMREEYEYNASGSLSKEMAYGGDGSPGIYTEYEYDSSDVLLEETCFRADGTVLSGISYKYDDSGRLEEEIYLENYYDKKKYEYDASGNLFRELWMKEGRIAQYREYEYDTAGNQVKMTYHHISENVDRDVDIILHYREYEYDERGNMLTNVMYDSAGNVFYDEEYETNSAHYKYEYITW